MRGSDEAPETAVSGAADVSGTWNVHVMYTAGPSKHHSLTLSQDRQGGLSGVHAGIIGNAPVFGSVQGEAVTLRSELPSPGGPLPYVFTGVLSTVTGDGERMEGKLECPAQVAAAPTGGAAETAGEARWYAVRSVGKL